MQRNIKIYPSCCTSAYCGKTSESCPACPNYPRLKDFEQWREKHKAVQADHIWSPNVYYATI